MALFKGEAEAILQRVGIEKGESGYPDFYALPAGKVSELLGEAKEYGYRAPRDRNGSKGRYWYQYLKRVAEKEG